MAHAAESRIQPSNLYKVLACPASAGREAALPDERSTYAAEGTVAHQVAAAILAGADPHALRNITLDGFIVDDEMLDAVGVYVAYVRTLAADLGVQPLVEQRVRIGFLPHDGTTDCVLFDGKQLHVLDYKHGKGVAVGAERNPQLMAYAQAFIDEWEPLIDDLGALEVHLHIVQPRAGRPPSVWRTDWAELMRWESTVSLAVAEAVSVAPRYKAGEHCRFCRAKTQCETFIGIGRTVSSREAPPPDVDPALLAEELARVPAVRLWLSTIEQLGFDLLSRGVSVPGWKLVSGRATRRWADPDKVIEQAKRKRLPIDSWMPRELVSVAGLEKELGKKKFVDLGFAGLAEKGEGRPTVAPADNPRTALSLSTGPDDFATDDDPLLS